MTPENLLCEMNRRYASLIRYGLETSVAGFFARKIDQYCFPSIEIPRAYLRQLRDDPVYKNVHMFFNVSFFSKFICTFESAIKAKALSSGDPFYVNEKSATRLVLGQLLIRQWNSRQHHAVGKPLTITLLRALIEVEMFTEEYVQLVLRSEDPEQCVRDLLADATPRCSESSTCSTA